MMGRTEPFSIERWIRSDQGLASSMMEIVFVIGIVSMLLTIAVINTSSLMDDADQTQAAADARMIAVAILNFTEDNGFAPAFKSGDEAGRPDDPIFLVLESGGLEPAFAPDVSWPMNSADRDRLEHQLVENRPGGSAKAYRRRGEISFNRLRGWNGPYLTKLPSSNPWRDKYLVTIQLLTPQGVEKAVDELPEGARAAAFVISAGPNRTIETKFAQPAESFKAGGDDVVFRIE